MTAMFIPGFEMVREDRRVNGRKRRGVSVYLRKNRKYQIRDELNNDDIECFC